MLLAQLAVVSEAVTAARGRLAKRDLIAQALREASSAERRAVVAWLSGELREGKLRVGYAEIGRLSVLPAPSSKLTLSDVEAVFQAIATIDGRGALAERRERLIALFARATAEEQGFLRRILLGELRQGGLEGVMIEAVAKAAGTSADAIRRAVMLTGDLPEVAALAMSGDAAALSRVQPAMFTPLRPMLASPSDSLDAALAELGEAGSTRLEWKLDGARVQVHKRGDDVRVFTRALQELTASVPEIVEAVRALPARQLILDGETIALSAEGHPRPFQETLARFARRVDIGAARAETPLSVFFFDVLLCDEELLLDRALSERRVVLERVVPALHRVPSLETNAADVARAFFDGAIAQGHEGVMVKSLSAPYHAGSRGRSWQKVKRVHALDLVVLAAEWGSGRRRGWLSNLHFGARDPAGGFIMLGKTFKGMTDEVLAWQTEALLQRETRREGHIVFVRPELVAEFAFDDVQASPRYPGGMALRFARLLRYRPDKTADVADNIEAVRHIFVRSAVRQSRER